jgi:hypothetical protein
MSETKATPTPHHLWIVGIVGLLWNLMGAVDYLMTQTKNEAYMGQFSPEQLEFFYGFPVWLVALWALAVWGGVLGAVLLLLRRKSAVPVLLVSLLCMVSTAVHNYGFSSGAEIMGGKGLIFTGVIFVIALCLVIYARKMARRGVLA